MTITDYDPSFVKIRIEDPSTTKINDIYALIRGWCISNNCELKFSLEVNQKPIPYAIIKRPDVEIVFPDKHAFGFTTFIDISDYISDLFDYKIEIMVRYGHKGVQRLVCEIDESVIAAISVNREITNRKRQWCIEHLQCPICASTKKFHFEDLTIKCAECESFFIQETNALNFITPKLYSQFDLSSTQNVSAHPYDQDATRIINQVGQKGGMVLDCGAGFRRINKEIVINLEIVDYPTTDILAVGQALPFRKASFDAILSLAVLEHVSDPFKCASELVRVLKPGGILYCVVPFLQPEHGYPNHYYNMTRQGLANLFTDKMQLERHFVPVSGMPVHSLIWFLREYHRCLPKTLKERFSRLSIGELIRMKPENLIEENYVRELNEEGRWTLASTTAVILKKTAQ
jgi:SAM-dependent methyltransferase